MQPAGGGGGVLAAAQQGMFAIDTVSADEMMTSIQQIRGSLTKRLMRIDHLKTQAILGDLPEAQAIGKIDALVASGDSQSLEFVLQRFVEVLDDLQQAVQLGTRNYEQLDSRAAQGFQRIGE